MPAHKGTCPERGHSPAKERPGGIPGVASRKEAGSRPLIAEASLLSVQLTS